MRPSCYVQGFRPLKANDTAPNSALDGKVREDVGGAT
jgi:hypothetical protein